MINLFQFAAEDKSLTYLAQIFGTMNGVIPISSGAASGSTISILGTMFGTFNSVVLAVGVLIIIYVTVVGVMATAHEGEFMGKKWSSLWVPVRMVIGIAALVPSGSGYSGIQIVMMWIIVQGIGAADTLWNTVLSYVNIVGSPYAQIALPSTSVSKNMSDLFKALACDETARYTPTGDIPQIPNGNYYCATKGGCGEPDSFSPNKTTMQIGPNGMCGSLNYCNSQTACAGDKADSIECMTCNAQLTALGDIVSTLRGIAAQFAKVDGAYRDFYANAALQRGQQNSDWGFIYSWCTANGISQNNCVPIAGLSDLLKSIGAPTSATSRGVGAFPDPNAKYPQNASDEAVTKLYWPYGISPTTGSGDFTQTAVSYYMNQISAAVSTFIRNESNDPSSFSNSNLREASKLGWIFAGSYYYVISQMNSSNFKMALPRFDVRTQDPGSDCSSDNLSCYRNNFSVAGVLQEASASSEEGFFGSVPQLSSMNQPLGDTMSSLNDSFSKSIDPTAKNPLSQLQGFGTALLVIAQVFYVTLLSITIYLGVTGNLAIFGLGTGAINPMSGTFIMIYMVLLPALFGLIGLMIVGGGLLAVYLPLVPYVIFTIGAIGWLISTIETMVAGPLVALGILSPSGQHELLGSAQNALMLIFNVFLRPSLMIFGLIAAMLMATVAASMINFAFWGIVAQGIGGGGESAGSKAAAAGVYANPLELVIYFTAYIMLMVTALNKCFSAISIIPERVMRWIGGQGEQYGEAEALGEVKGGVQAGAGAAKGGAAHLAAHSRKAADKERERRAKKAQESPEATGENQPAPKGKGP